ncbi:MAG: TolC family protein [Candidatus Kapaibacterium sp.]
MKRLTILFIFALGNLAFAQTTLQDCYRLAREHHPLAGRDSIYDTIEKRQMLNLDAAWYPQIDLFGQAQYQSDVTEIPIDIQLPNVNLDMPQIPKTQYKAGVQVNQIIWDGGALAARRGLVRQETLARKSESAADMLSVEQKVNDAFFGVMALRQNKSIIQLNMTTLETRLESVNSAVRAGVTTESQANILRAELLRLRQRVDELNSAAESSLYSLARLTDRDFGSDLELEFPREPGIKGIIPDAASRPEYKAFDHNRKSLDESESLADAEIMPKFFAFGQGAIGRPGLDMFDPDPQPFYIVGLKMSWKFWDWGTSSREREVLELRRSLIDKQEETLRMNINIGGQRYIDRISALGELIAQDKEIIELKQKIVDAAASQMDNGTITATEYISEFNSLMEARMNLQSHRLELIRAKYEYLTFLGLNNIEQ